MSFSLVLLPMFAVVFLCHSGVIIFSVLPLLLRVAWVFCPLQVAVYRVGRFIASPIYSSLCLPAPYNFPASFMQQGKNQINLKQLTVCGGGGGAFGSTKGQGRWNRITTQYRSNSFPFLKGQFDEIKNGYIYGLNEQKYCFRYKF